jgi:uncharacterized alkaline shock family protein YloU
VALNDVTAGYRLPCGRGLERVWDHLDRADEHQLTCPHCRTAADSLRALREATRELITEDDRPAPDLVGRIMSAVRAEVRRGSVVRLGTPEPGAVQVSEQAIAVVLRYAADAVHGVRARRCSIRTVGTGEHGESLVEIELTLAVSIHTGAGGEALDEVRTRVGAAAAARVGLRVEVLNLLVEDVFDEEDR